MVFDNLGQLQPAQTNLFGMGYYPVPDIGSSADSFYLTTSAPPPGGSYLVNNPGPGAVQTLPGAPLDNFGWDLRLNGLAASIVRANADPRPAGGTAQWTVTLTGGPVTGLSTTNFGLVGTHTGASIASVTPVNATTWTVTANLGAGAGTLGLNLANTAGLNTNISNAPFAGEVYSVLCTATTTFSFTGGVQAYIVPAGVTSITIDARGAQGTAGALNAPQNGGAGGLGGQAAGTLAVTPGQLLQINVGGQAGFNGGGAPGAPGIGTGGSPTYPSGSGGGASDVRTGAGTLGERVIVAGGGGGGSAAPQGSCLQGPGGDGGTGGGLSGTGGSTGAGCGSGGTGGVGADQLTGGNGGLGNSNCSASGVTGSLGVLGSGGSGGNGVIGCSGYTGSGGGGGGGGYYGGGRGGGGAGGGGGAWAGGGGGAGSSYITGLTAASTSSGVQTGNGVIVITASGSCSAATATTVTSNANPSVFGQPVTFTATVSPNPGAGATVNFVIDGGAPVATTTNASGVATTATSALSVGTHTVVANFLGGSGFDPSSGTLTPVQTVNMASTTTAVTSSPNPSVWGQSVTMTATISVTSPGAGAPTGTVNFLDGGFAIPSCQNRPVSLVSSLYQASCTTSALPVGAARFLNGVYSGDGNFNGSASPNGYTITVNKADTTTTITSDNPDPSVLGQNYTVVFSVLPVSPGAGTPSGTVAVTDGTNNCSATVAVGQCTLPSTSVGPKTLTATYPGDSFFNGSNDTEAHVVGKANTTTTVTASPASPSIFGQSVTFTATVAIQAPGAGPPNPTGTVSFNIDGNIYCANTPINGSGVATCTQAGLPALPAGLRNVVALYGGDANFNGSAGTLNYTVNKALPTLTITGDTPDPSIIGQPYAVTWTVGVTAPGAGTPTGTVTIADGIDTCTAPVGAGVCNMVSTTPGNKALTGFYSGRCQLQRQRLGRECRTWSISRSRARYATASQRTGGRPTDDPAVCFTGGLIRGGKRVGRIHFHRPVHRPVRVYPNTFHSEPFLRYFTLTGNITGADFLVYANANAVSRTIRFDAVCRTGSRRIDADHTEQP
ncbi:MAG: Ig-like domain repeat protein [Acidobacteria bacterium]|nr:Ig-like domain repeat protein [Acidobacteriota bacterium]